MELLKGNRPLWVLSLSVFFFYIAYTAWMAVAVFYVRDVIGEETFLGRFFAIQGIAYMIGTLASGRAIARVGKKRLIEWLLWIAAVALIIQYYGVFAGKTLIMASVVIFTAVLACGFVVFWSMIADTVEYGEWHQYERAEGLIYGSFSFVTKVAMAAGGGLAGLFLDYVGYVPGHVTSTAFTGINSCITLLPALMLGLSAMVLRFYPISESYYRQLVISITQRKVLAEEAVQ